MKITFLEFYRTFLDVFVLYNNSEFIWGVDTTRLGLNLQIFIENNWQIHLPQDNSLFQPW